MFFLKTLVFGIDIKYLIIGDPLPTSIINIFLFIFVPKDIYGPRSFFLCNKKLQNININQEYSVLCNDPDLYLIILYTVPARCIELKISISIQHHLLMD